MHVSRGGVSLSRQILSGRGGSRRKRKANQEAVPGGSVGPVGVMRVGGLKGI